MANDPPISFRGALKVLGKDEPAWLRGLDKILGGFILASGAVPGLDAVWGWVDQKTEAVSLLREGINSFANRLSGCSGLLRHELVHAAHTVLVLSTFFDAARAIYGTQFTNAKVSDREKVAVTIGGAEPGEALIRKLYTAAIPAPSALRGFEANVLAVEEWARGAGYAVADFLTGLDMRPPSGHGIGAKAAENYRSGYLELMTSVPEFALWAGQVESAAIQAALGRIESLLPVGPQIPLRDLPAIVAKVNQSELVRPIVDVDTDGYGLSAAFPPIEEIFITPSYMLDGKRYSNLELFLAQHFSSVESTKNPLLLLGHPGAGKSLLMKVMAARLSTLMYTVVRVPLRSVEANAPIGVQIDQALAMATSGRISTWADLSDSSTENMRVVLLDGLDELLQATSQDRHGYLQEVQEFQRREALVGSPVAVVVTSRTLVADRVNIPQGSPVVALDAFDESQIETWIDHWNRFNVASQARPMRLDLALAQLEIASQPLLLLMLTLYFADPEVELRSDLSTSELYGRLLETYASREVTKKAGKVLRPERLRQATRDQLRRLAVAALGMFNRGRQSISETQLTSDLVALGEEFTSGTRVLGEFFFVHADEAKVSLSPDNSISSLTYRTYEFLHATFAEYLVARQVLVTIAQVASTVSKDGARPRPDDDLLFALLSHQPLAIQPPILSFIRAHYETCPQRERRAAEKILNMLIAGYRSRPASRHFNEYRPASRDHLRALASYSANLLLLRVAASVGRSAKLTDLWPDDDQASQWRSCIALWQAGMDESGYRATLGAFWYDDGEISEFRRQLSTDYAYEVHRSVLRDEMSAARTLGLGQAVLARRADLPPSWYLKSSASQQIVMDIELLRALPVASWPKLDEMLKIDRDVELRGLSEALWSLVSYKPGPWPAGVARRLAEVALDLPKPDDPLVLAAASFRHKEVFDLLQERHVRIHGKAGRIYQLALTRHSHPYVGAGWEIVVKVEQIVSVLLSDNSKT